MSEHDQRPAVGVAHVVLHTDRMEESAQFMRTIGMRPVFDGPTVSVYEMRGGTHLILMHKDNIVEGEASFDLMVDDLHATHQRFTSLGLAPSPIEARTSIDHEVFTVREPAGQVITFFQVMPQANPHDAKLGAQPALPADRPGAVRLGSLAPLGARRRLKRGVRRQSKRGHENDASPS